MNHLALGAGAEFDRIRAIAGALGAAAGSLGDDCAVVTGLSGSLLVSTDLSVERVHFRREWLTMEEIGWRAAAAALSDLAAEGASCIGLLAAVAVPPGAPESEVVALMRGIGDAATSVGGTVLGGDLSAASEWSVAITVLGQTDHAVSRAGATAGDGVWVTGSLGGARAALEAWMSGGEPGTEFRTAFAHPVPRLGAGRWLAAHGAAAMLDLSDGLAGDAAHLAAASGVALDLDLGALPIADGIGWAAERAGEPIPVFAARGGEDYELLVALPAAFGAADAAAFSRECAVPLTRIGRVADGNGLRLRLGGRPVFAAGFDHFA